MSVHRIKGRRYIYETYRDQAGKIHSFYIGPKDEFDRKTISREITNRVIEYNLVRHRPNLSPNKAEPNFSLARNFDKFARVMENAIPA